MSLLDEVLDSPPVRKAPPVLVDVGAAESLHPRWDPIAERAICVAFEADDRNGGRPGTRTDRFRTLYTYDRLVAPEPSTGTEFHLTSAPHFSSILEPDEQSLANWGHRALFEVDDTERLPAVGLSEALSDLGLDRVDWFKSNAQGVDLRLFESLPVDVRERVLVAELEPGILDSYRAEDKLSDALAAFEGRPYWVADLSVSHTGRVSRVAAEQLSALERKLLPHVATAAGSAPAAAALTVMHEFGDAAAAFDEREFRLGWAFATVLDQHGFALELAAEGARRFDDPLYGRMVASSRRRFRRACVRSLPGLTRRALRDPGKAARIAARTLRSLVPAS